MNASHNRGIDVVRNDIISFCKRSASRMHTRATPSKHVQSIASAATATATAMNHVILDEADAMPRVAQHALQAEMERANETTHFCLIVNSLSRIVAPIRSRCLVLRFKKVSDDAVAVLLHRIIADEGILADSEAVAEVVYVSNGDLRAAISLFHHAFACHAPHRQHIHNHNPLSSNPDKKEEGDIKKFVLRRHHIQDVAGLVSDDTLRGFYTECRNATDAFQLWGFAHAIYSRAIPPLVFLQQLVLFIIKLPDTELDELEKAHILIQIARVEHSLLHSANETLQANQ